MTKPSRKSRVLLIAVFCICNLAWGSVFQARAATGTHIDPGQINLPAFVLLNTTQRVYIQVYNDGDADVEGQVKFIDSDILIGTKPFSARAAGKAEEVWFTWKPTTIGNHTVTIQARNDAGYPDLDQTNNTYTKTVLVDIDTDHDGTPDSIDSDDDNDGLYDFQEKDIGTDPKKYDTDGDGVGDKEDAFPLDPKRSKADPPVSTGSGSGSGSGSSGLGSGSGSGSGSNSGTGTGSNSTTTNSGGGQAPNQDSGSSSTTVGSAPSTLANGDQATSTQAGGDQVALASGTTTASVDDGLGGRVAGVSDEDQSWKPLQAESKGAMASGQNNQNGDDADRKKRMWLWLAAGISALVTLIFFLLYFLAKRRKEEKKGK